MSAADRRASHRRARRDLGDRARDRPRARAALEVALVGRDPQRLADAAASLRADAADASCSARTPTPRSGARSSALGGADLVVVAVGRLGERGGIPDELGDAVEVLRVNVVVAGSLLLAAARRLRDQGHGTLIVLSSVAGERVRPANLVYGAAKAGLDALARGVARRPARRRRAACSSCARDSSARG